MSRYRLVFTAPDDFQVLVNLIPSRKFLDHLFPDTIAYFMPVRSLPDWFPGVGFKRIARERRQMLCKMVEGPYRLVRKQMVRHGAFTRVCGS